jgi:hypothetical protein
MNDEQARSVWVFNGASSSFPAGVFDSEESATAWIEQNRLSGTLTEYPVNIGVYDWAIQHNHYSPKKEIEPKFVERFTSYAQAHVHFEFGKRQG